MSSSGTARSPVVVETTRGKNVMRQVMMMRGIIPAPSVTTRMGAIATIGVDWMMTSSGTMVRDIKGELTSTIAKGMLSANEIKKPMMTISRVAQIFASQVDGGTCPMAARICDGRGTRADLCP